MFSEALSAVPFNKANAEELVYSALSDLKRKGMDGVIAWLRKSDFAVAPASTKYHGAHEGGLIMHSMQVCQTMLRMHGSLDVEQKLYSKGSIILCSLLHDICKTNFYKISFRNVKNDKGKWESVPYYEVEDKLPLGHGSKSCILLLGLGLKMTAEEMQAIVYHMGGFSSEFQGGDQSISAAYKNNPLAVALHIADLAATYIDGR